MALEGVGIWSAELRFHKDREAIPAAAAELEELGYSALFVPGGPGGNVLGAAGRLLEATELVTVATGVLNVWAYEPADVAAGVHQLREAHGDRFLLGLGISHSKTVDKDEPGRYRKPLAKMHEVLDGLDAAPDPVPVSGRALAALGPRMLELAAMRAAGAHPYLVTPKHTATARDALGRDAILAPEQAVLLDPDPESARRKAREHLERYLPLPNYANNMLREGFEESDLAAGGSDRLIDGLVAWGDEAAIATRVAEHLSAGASHVCIQVVGEAPGALPLDTWRALAPALRQLERVGA